MTSLAGTRLSEQPIHKSGGDCPFDNFSKYSGSSLILEATQFLFPSIIFL